MTRQNRYAAAMMLCGTLAAGTLAAGVVFARANVRTPATDDLSTAADGRPATAVRTSGDPVPAKVFASDTTIKVGAVGNVLITIKAMGAHKVNKEYPHKVKMAESPAGLEIVKAVLKKKDATFVDKKTLTFEVPVKAKTPGKHIVQGQVKYSVCNDSQCVIQKAQITAMVTVR